MDYILETLGKVGFEWKMALFNLVNFLIVFWILKKMFFAPTLKMIEERKRKARETEENFLQAQTELAMSQKKSEEFLNTAKQEANDIIARAVADSASIAQDLREKAKHEVEAIIAQAKQVIASEKEQMKGEIRKETVELVVAAIERVLGEKMTDEKDKKFIAGIISKL